MTPKLAQTLQTLEESLWRSETRFDDALMRGTFADDFFEYGRSGRVYGREEMLLGSMAGTPILARLPLRDFAVRLLAPDVAQVTYISEVTYGDAVEYANRSSIWTLVDGTWRLRFHQGTPRAA